MKPLAIDLFCGLGGWTEGLLAEGYYVLSWGRDMSELTEVIDNLTAELERFREMYAETLIEHSKERDRWAARIRELQASQHTSQGQSDG